MTLRDAISELHRFPKEEEDEDFAADEKNFL